MLSPIPAGCEAVSTMALLHLAWLVPVVWAVAGYLVMNPYVPQDESRK